MQDPLSHSSRILKVTAHHKNKYINIDIYIYIYIYIYIDMYVCMYVCIIHTIYIHVCTYRIREMSVVTMQVVSR